MQLNFRKAKCIAVKRQTYIAINVPNLLCHVYQEHSGSTIDAAFCAQELQYVDNILYVDWQAMYSGFEEIINEIEEFNQTRKQPRQLVLTGGLVNNPFFYQTLKERLEVDIVVLRTPEAASVKGALLLSKKQYDVKNEEIGPNSNAQVTNKKSPKNFKPKRKRKNFIARLRNSMRRKPNRRGFNVQRSTLTR